MFRFTTRAVALAAIFLPAVRAFSQQAYDRFPADKAADVNPDTHLVITFAAPPALGTSGKIVIYDAADDKVVDTLDLAIPASPPRGGRGAAPAPARGGLTASATQAPFQYDYKPNTATNANTTPGTASSSLPATPTDAQLTIIGGFSDAYHFYPVIIHDKSATIYPHNNLLSYGKSYYVTIDKGVLDAPGFDGFAGKTGWTFSTKKSPRPADAKRIIVAADGSGDCNTVQGAIDLVSDKTAAPPGRRTIFIRNGTYEEIVYMRNKTNLTLVGEDRKKVIVTYDNNDVFNHSPDGYTSNEKPGTFPYRRPSFMVDHCQGIQIVNLTLRNPSTSGQAEALLIMGGQNIVSNVDLWGNTDTIQFNDSVYTFDTFIDGGGDYLWGRGPCYFVNCDLQEHGNSPGGWVRSTAASHGFCFRDCRFNAPNAAGAGPVLARNTAAYPNSEWVMLNCAISSKFNPAGFTIPGATDAMHYWEFNTTRLEDGKPFDTSRRVAGSKQLTMEKDAETIKNYGDPAWFLDGWQPTMAPLMVTVPQSATVAAGQPITLTAKAAAVPAPAYQWLKNGVSIPGATDATLSIKSAQVSDAGDYSLIARNDYGTVTSAAAGIKITGR